MKPAPWVHLQKYRQQFPPYKSELGDPFGAFLIPYPKTGQMLAVLANNANEYSGEWEHVSVSLRNRCPNWFEMDFIKDLFWLPEETVLQYHVAKSNHINFHPYCLHLWRPTTSVIPLPPSILVGPPR